VEGVTVTIKYLVNFSEKTGKAREDVQFNSGADLNFLAGWLKDAYGIEVPAKGMMTLLNGHGWNQYPEKMGRKLADGDVVIIMPSISGG